MDLHFAQKCCIFVVQEWRYLGRTGYLHFFMPFFAEKSVKLLGESEKIFAEKEKLLVFL